MRQTLFPNLYRCTTIAFLLLSAIGSEAFTAEFTNVQFLSGNEVLLQNSNVILTNTTRSFNTMNDNTGAKLERPDDSADDFELTGSNVAGALGSTSLVLSPGGASTIRATNGYSGSPSQNNPGSITYSTFTLRFASHLIVTNASFTFSSLNTAGISWEYSVIQLLDENGNPFSDLSGLDFTPGAAGQYLVGNSAGFSGQAGVGNWVSAFKGTVTGVGTDQTSTGSSGSNDNITITYSAVALPESTRIGGIRWSTFLEDVRGVNNGSTNLTASLTDFSLSGRIYTPIGVRLISFCAERTGAGATVEWRISADESFAGFNLFRSTEGMPGGVRLNRELIVEPTLKEDDQWLFQFLDASVSEGQWFYTLEEVSLDGTLKLHGPIATAAASTAQNALPQQFELLPNTPNPFNPETTLAFTLCEATDATLAVYDMSGRLIRTLASGAYSAGRYSIVWDGRDDAGEQVSSGIYICRLVAGSRVQSRKMTLVK